MRKEEINECRTQLQSGVLNLQLSLQLVNLHATYLAPQIANQALLEKLNEIDKSLAASKDVDENLHDCAKSYVERGTLLWEKSQASSTGSFQRSSKPKVITEWLDQIHALDALRLDDSLKSTVSSEDDLDSSPGPSSLLTEDAPLASSKQYRIPHLQPIDTKIDEEDEFALEMIQKALDSGRVSYAEGGFRRAENRLKECLNLILKLSEHRRRTYDIEEIHLLLALCAFELHDSATAEEALLSSLDRNTGTDAHAKTQFEAGSALAILYARSQKYETARMTCNNVYKGRRRLLGKDDDLCHETLALLACIHELSDQTDRADTYRSMIPEEKEEALTEKFRQLIQSPVLYQSASLKQADFEIKNSWTSVECPTTALTLSPVNKLVARACISTKSRDILSSRDVFIELRRMTDCNIVRVLVIKKDTEASCLAFNNDGQRLASGHGGIYKRQILGGVPRSLHIYVWDVDNGVLLHKLSNAKEQFNLKMFSLFYTPDDKQLITTFTYDAAYMSRMGAIKPGCAVFDCKTQKVVFKSNNEPCWVTDASRDGSMICFREGTSVVVRRVEDYSKVRELLDTDAASFTPDNDLVTFTKDGSFFKWSRDGVQRRWLRPAKPVNEQDILMSHRDLVFTKEGHVFAVCRTDKDDCLYLIAPELGLWRSIQEYNKGSRISHVAVSRCAEYLVYVRSVGDKESLKLLDIEEQLKLGQKIIPAADLTKSARKKASLEMLQLSSEPCP